jgi:hypothetical protein
VGEAHVKPVMMPAAAPTSTSPDLGPAVEQQVATDMIRRSLPVLPVLVLVAGLIWGVDGALSAAFAIAIVFLNFLFSASLLAWSARISLPLMMVAALGGFVLRLALITVAVLLVKDQSWVSLVPLGFTLIITHLGLLIWETRHLSLSLAYPTVKPSRRKP